MKQGNYRIEVGGRKKSCSARNLYAYDIPVQELRERKGQWQIDTTEKTANPSRSDDSKTSEDPSKFQKENETPNICRLTLKQSKPIKMKVLEKTIFNKEWIALFIEPAWKHTINEEYVQECIRPYTLWLDGLSVRPHELWLRCFWSRPFTENRLFDCVRDRLEFIYWRTVYLCYV